LKKKDCEHIFKKKFNKEKEYVTEDYAYNFLENSVKGSITKGELDA